MSITSEANIENIYTFSIIALFVLLIACINFMNLATARSATRSKEVGVRKVLGSQKSHLILQFLSESILISGIAIFLTLIFTIVLLPHFNELSGKNFSSTDLFTVSNLLLLMGIGLTTGLLAGLYPALYLSAIQPVLALKGLFRLSGHSYLRKGLVTFQFAVSILLIICTFIVYSQVHFMNTKDLGIDTEHILLVSNTEKLDKNLNVMQQALLSLPDVQSVSLTNAIPAQFVPNWTYKTDEPSSRSFNPDNVFVTETYDDVLDIEMLAGDFFLGKASDSAYIVVNEALVRQLDWQLSEAVGKKLFRPTEGSFEIIGVMKDFHTSSLRQSLSPMLLRYSEYLKKGEFGGTYMMVNVSDNYPKVIETLRTQWETLASSEILNYEFLDEKFNSLYENERNFGKIFSTFSVMAILIACLGLFALSAFMLERRMKEVAIRRILGASLLKIVSIFVSGFAGHIAVAALLAIGAGIYLADYWLESFAYRVVINPLYFIWPIVLVSVIAIVTIATQVLKTGNVNPARLLKDE